MNTVINFFTGDQPIVVFEQHYPEGLNDTSLQDNMQALSSFPTLQINPSISLKYLTFQSLWDLGTIGQCLSLYLMDVTQLI